MSLYMVKMTSYDENIKKSKNFEKSIFSFFVPMALGTLNFNFRGRKLKICMARRKSTFSVGNSESGRNFSIEDDG